jgi:hypothetical protein
MRGSFCTLQPEFVGPVFGRALFVYICLAFSYRKLVPRPSYHVVCGLLMFVDGAASLFWEFSIDAYGIQHYVNILT